MPFLLHINIIKKRGRGMPDNLNLLNSLLFKFEIEKFPNITYFCQSCSIPGIQIGEAQQATPFVDVSVHHFWVIIWAHLEVKIEFWRSKSTRGLILDKFIKIAQVLIKFHKT